MVKFLEYQGEKIPVKIRFKALRDFQNETGKADLDNASFAEIEVLFWHAYKSGVASSKSEGFSLKFKREDMEDILDEVYMDFLKIIPSFFEEDKKPAKKK